MKRYYALIAIVAVVAWYAVAALSSSSNEAPKPSTTTNTQVIEEDEPGWNCHTMGNKVCGPNGPYADEAEGSGKR